MKNEDKFKWELLRRFWFSSKSVFSFKWGVYVPSIHRI